MSHNQPDADGHRGLVVNTASVAAFEGQVSDPGVTAGQRTFQKPTAWSGHEITPGDGLFSTPLLAGLPEKVRTFLGRQAPFPARLGHPAEFAHLVQALAENPMVNGEVVRLDGALRMQP
ncbi:HCD2 dehydrogenase, partial [Loxia leucoptera]|nr:HCD2 dehydrogenase [Loxia leucoptera]